MELKDGKIVIRFQNFSSLQFIAVNADITDNKDKFQNFSSLQFI